MKLPEHREKQMAYVSSFERSAIKKGVQKGEALALQKLLSKRFGVIPAEIVGQISRLAPSKLTPGWTGYGMHQAWTPFLPRHGIENGLPPHPCRQPSQDPHG